jgi:ankyrin repeat protein
VDDWPAEAQLIAAASAGDLARLRAVLAEHPGTVNARTRLPCSVASGYCALHFAAFNGHVACVGELLAAGAEPSTRDDRGATPLHWLAASAGLAGDQARGEACLRLLLAAGADPDARDEDGETALHSAARLGNVAAVRGLAEAGAYLEVGGCLLPPNLFFFLSLLV